MKIARLIIGLMLGALCESHAQGRLVTLITNGPSANRLNIVILAEGYTSNQFSIFTNQARNLATKFLSAPPYSTYGNYFNAYGIFVASEQSGSDHPSRGVLKNTYFNSTFDSFSITRLVTIPPNDRNGNYADGRGKVDALLRDLLPEYDIPLVLVNDSEYGGSGGPVAVTSTEASSSEIAIHEIGHSFGALGDEYEDLTPGYPDIEDPNTTRETRRDYIKWRHWILESTPLPTPESGAYSSVIGLFEGAHYQPKGWYRPKLDCKMRSLNVPFCAVCQETLVLAQYGRINLIENYSPKISSFTIWPGAVIEAGATTLKPKIGTIQLQWKVDATPVEDATGATITLRGSELVAGSHKLELTASDPTTLVRRDPLSRLIEKRSWNVTVLESGPVITVEPTTVSSNAITAKFTSSMAANLVLETSVDLDIWTGIKTNISAQELEYTAPVDPLEPARFFRVTPVPVL